MIVPRKGSDVVEEAFSVWVIPNSFSNPGVMGSARNERIASSPVLSFFSIESLMFLSRSTRSNGSFANGPCSNFFSNSILVK